VDCPCPRQVSLFYAVDWMMGGFNDTMLAHRKEVFAPKWG